MQPQDAFTHTEPNLLPVLHELRSYEPIFHTHAFGLTTADCERRMASDYWEVGASGRRYSHAFIRETLSQHPPIDAAIANWQAIDFALQVLGPDTYLLTYTLNQNPRLTRRSTIWRNTPEGWQILYHQGTIVSDEPSQSTPQS